MFGPRYPGINENNETENIGRDVVARHEVQYWYETILSEVETIQQEELERTQESGSLDSLVDQGLPNMVPYRYVMYCFKTYKLPEIYEFDTYSIIIIMLIEHILSF